MLIADCMTKHAEHKGKKWVHVQGSTSGYMYKVLQVGTCVRFYKWVHVQGSTSGYMCKVLQVGTCVRFYKWVHV